MKQKQKPYREEFARFFEEPSRETLREVLRNNVGELNELDFKEIWPEPPELPRHMLAFANYGGGCLVFGVQQGASLKSVGLAEIKDKADFGSSVETFLPLQLQYHLLDFTFDDSEYAKIKGMKFQVLIIEDTPQYLPFVSEKDGKHLRRGAIYTRRDTKSEEVTYEELQNILNRRIETSYSSSGEIALEKHFSELKALYDMIPKYETLSAAFESIPSGLLGAKKNPKYPTETFQDFACRMLNLKKQIIEEVVGRR